MYLRTDMVSKRRTTAATALIHLKPRGVLDRCRRISPFLVLPALAPPSTCQQLHSYQGISYYIIYVQL